MRTHIPIRRTVRAALVVLCVAIAPAMVQAQSFSVSLAGLDVGTFTFDASGPTMTSVLDGTPLGVGDGTYEGTSRRARTEAGDLVTQYIGRSDDRVISVLFDAGRALETVVSPTSEATDMSDAARVTQTVLDPVEGFAHIADAHGCPGPFRMYDGRRVIEVATAGSTPANGQLQCTLDYRVVAGPGHLSPFRFTSLVVVVTYATGGGQSLREIAVSAGGFTLYLTR